MRKLYLLPCLFLALSTCAVPTVSVTGTVFDENDSPMRQCSVFTSKNNGVLTDSLGRYSIPVPVNKIVRINFVSKGYKNASIRYSQDEDNEHYDVRMEVDSTLLRENARPWRNTPEPPDMAAIERAYDKIRTTDITALIASKMEKLFDEQRDRIGAAFDHAEASYQREVVLHAEIDWDHYINTGEIVINPEASEIPFDLFYFHENHPKYFITAYSGTIFGDETYGYMMEGSSGKVNRALKKIRQKQPDHMLVCEMIPYSILYSKDSRLYVFHLTDGTDAPLESYMVRHRAEINEYEEWLASSSHPS
jgi:hypothetical protein